MVETFDRFAEGGVLRQLTGDGSRNKLVQGDPMIPRENLGVLSPANNDYDNEKILNLDALGNIIFKSDFERNFF